MGFIYKITNILTNKCYIGETKKNNPETRWNEHKRKIEQGIGCPALQDAVKKYGINNFTFKIIIICFDEDRYKYEIQYIQKYNSMVPNGYNLTKGGEGGGFHGKKHISETKNKISQIIKQKYIDNPELKTQMSERQKILMNSKEVCNKIKLGLMNSEKWKLAKEQKRSGNNNNRKHTEESKNKIKESIKNYFKISEKNVEKHRNIMGKSKGIKVEQYDIHNNLINSFISINETSRHTGISSSSIKNYIKTNNPCCGFIWKKSR
jgi:group I intron endonuclease